jgi:hypothetical protein
LVHQLKNALFLSFSLAPSLPPSIHQGRDGGRREIEYLNTLTGQPARATVELDCQAEFQREFGAHFAAGTTMPLPWGQMGAVGCCVPMCMPAAAAAAPVYTLPAAPVVASVYAMPSPTFAPLPTPEFSQLDAPAYSTWTPLLGAH